MVYWAERSRLVSYLRHTLITCDETGVCEAVLEVGPGEAKPGGLSAKLNSAAPQSSSDEDDSADDGRRSPDLHLQPSHRERSNTAILLDKIRDERRKKAQRKVIRWRSPPQLSPDELALLFPERKEISATSPNSATNSSQPSLLSQLLLQESNTPENPYQDYAAFQAPSGGGGKSFKILVPGGKWMSLCVVPTARISQLVGLVCWRSFEADPETAFLRGSPRPGPQDFLLRMAEENGEVEEDLPPLNPAEVLSRLGFPFLALLPKPKAGKRKKAALLEASSEIVVQTGWGEKIILPCQSPDSQLRSIRDAILEGRDPPSRPDLPYVMEKLTEPGQTLDMDSSLAAANTNQFVLLRANSARPQHLKAAPSASSSPSLPKQEPQGECLFYSVELVGKGKKGGGPAQLVVCGDRLEVSLSSAEEDSRRSSAGSITAKLFRPSPLFFRSRVIKMEEVGAVESLDESHFRIFHLESGAGGGKEEWRILLFHAPTSAADIVETMGGFLRQDSAAVRSFQASQLRRKPSILRRLSSFAARNK